MSKITAKKNIKVQYPYLPKGRKILYVPLSNKMMKEAKKICDEQTGCCWWPTGAVVVKNNKIIGRGANSGVLQQLCPRIQKKAPTGTGYEDCKKICKQTSHAEISSINDALKNNHSPAGADLYLFGHWWCCKPCWDYIIKHKIKKIFLLNDAHYIFKRDKRYKLMDKNEKKIKKGGIVKFKDIIWTLTKSKICEK